MKYLHGDLDVNVWCELLGEFTPAEIKNSEYSIENGFIIVE